MTNLDKLIPEVIHTAGGELIGRVRLQKIMYLLDRKGLNSGANYFYHHYGPYSDEISNGIEDAKFFGHLQEDIKYREGDGAPYSVFKVDASAEIQPTAKLGKLNADRAQVFLDKLVPENSTVLELAATIDWLKHYEKVEDWKAELKKRKGQKVLNGRLKKAEKILDNLDLK